MSVIRTVFRYQMRDLIRSRWLIAYALFFAAASEGFMRYGGDDAKALLSLSTVVLFVVPLVTIVYGTIYLYQSREFTEVLLAQPVRRGQLFAGLYLGITVALTIGVLGGIGVPFIAHGGLSHAGLRGAFATLVFVAAALTWTFTALACVIALLCEDRLRGLGAAIGTWLALALLYDGLVLALVAAFDDLPLERPLLAAMLANPVDLARVLLLLRFDNAALMGYTGAVFQRFFAGSGAVIAVAALLTWIAVPAYAGSRAFRTRDF